MRPSGFQPDSAPQDVLDCLQDSPTQREVEQQERYDSLPARLPGTFARPAPLRVHSLQTRQSVQHVEHWSHTDEDGFHLPLTSPAIQSVRSKAESLPVPSTPSQAAQALRQSQDRWYQLPPPSPAVQSVRSLQEDSWARPSNDAAIARIRQMQEGFFPGVNDLASVALAAASRNASLRAVSSVPSRTVFSAESASAYHASAAVPAPSLGRSPLLSVTSNTDDKTPPQIQIIRDSDNPNQPGPSQSHTENTPDPAGGAVTGERVVQTLSGTTMAGASVWGVCARQVQADLGVVPSGQGDGRVGVGGSTGMAQAEDVSAIGSVLSHAAAVAAVRRGEEDVWHRPRVDTTIETIREQEEMTFRQPTSSPKVEAIRRESNAFRSVPSSPAIAHVRAGEDQWRTLPSTRSQPAAHALSQCLEDPFGKGRVWSGQRRAVVRTVSAGHGVRPCNSAALARNISLQHPQPAGARDGALSGRVSNHV